MESRLFAWVRGPFYHSDRPFITIYTYQAVSSSPHPAKSIRVVAIGGGTGLSTLLRGLKRYVPAPAASRRASDAGRPLADSRRATDAPIRQRAEAHAAL